MLESHHFQVNGILIKMSLSVWLETNIYAKQSAVY